MFFVWCTYYVFNFCLWPSLCATSDLLVKVSEGIVYIFSSFTSYFFNLPDHLPYLSAWLFTFFYQNKSCLSQTIEDKLMLYLLPVLKWVSLTSLYLQKICILHHDGIIHSVHWGINPHHLLKNSTLLFFVKPP